MCQRENLMPHSWHILVVMVLFSNKAASDKAACMKESPSISEAITTPLLKVSPRTDVPVTYGILQVHKALTDWLLPSLSMPLFKKHNLPHWMWHWHDCLSWSSLCVLFVGSKASRVNTESCSTICWLLSLWLVCLAEASSHERLSIRQCAVIKLHASNCGRGQEEVLEYRRLL